MHIYGRIGRLAVCRFAQGDGIGKILLADAIKHTLAVSDDIAIYALVVDAINQADNRDKVVVCVDEIQKVPALLDEVQYLYDTYPGRFHFLLTGSSARKLKTSSANLLPGRAHLFNLCPLILRERQDASESRVFPVETEPFETGFSEPALDDLLLFGGLPGITL